MKKFVINMPSAVKSVIDALEKAGHRAYIVGGCVRDCIMGKEPNDWDVTTSSTPDQTKQALKNFYTIDTGIKHGTVTALVNNSPVEITTFRIDGGYLDSRHPENVSFTDDLTEDLKRRDFTMNAIAYSEKEGIIDPFGGVSDILSRTIRAVGNPDLRFREDALRILRALRFSSTLDFTVESTTAESAVSHRELLNNISKERVMSEFSRLLCGKNVLNILLNFKQIFFTVIPELTPCDNFEQKTPYHIYDVYTHIAHTVSLIKSDPQLRLAMLLHDIGKPACFAPDLGGVGHFPSHAKKSAEIANEILKRLKFDRATIDYVTLLVKNHDIPITADEKMLLRRLNQFGEKTLKDLILIKRADNLAKSESVLPRQKEFDKTEKLLGEILTQKKCFSLKELNINGDEIKSLGAAEGEKIGEILKILLDDVIDGKIPNEKSLLLREVKRLL